MNGLVLAKKIYVAINAIHVKKRFITIYLVTDALPLVDVKRNPDGGKMKIIITATIECPICGQPTSDRSSECCNCHNRI